MSGWRAWFCCLAAALCGCRSLTTDPPSAFPDLTREDIRFSRALARYGQGLLMEGEDGRPTLAAVEEFEAAARMDPGVHRLYSKAAIANLQQHRYDEAIAILEEACRQTPDAIQPWLDLATTCQLTQRHERAVEAYRRILKQERSITYAYLNLARVLFQLQQDDEAIKVLNDGLKHAAEPNAIMALAYSQATGFLEREAPVRALRCLDFLARNNPDQQSYRCLMGELEEKLGRPKQAMRHYRAAMRAEKPVPDAFIRAAMLQMDEDPEQALKTIRKASERFPEDLTIQYALGYLYLNTDHFPEAVAQLQKFAEAMQAKGITVLNPEFYILYGSACEQAGLFDRAVNIFEECIANHPDTATALNYVAYMWAERGINLQRAETYVLRALLLDPENGAFIDTLGWVYYQQGRYTEAFNQLVRALQHLPDDPVVNDHAGDAAARLGQTDDAIRFWRASLAADPDNAAVAAKLDDAQRDPKALDHPAADPVK